MRLKERIPPKVKRGFERPLVHWAGWTSALRVLPDFSIIGAQHSGTTTLHRYLLQHPAVARPIGGKEVHFFDWYYDRGLDWYRSHFCTAAYARLAGRGGPVITGDDTPNYLFHPKAPLRMAKHIPDARLIVLLRNPVDRAYSQYRRELDRGKETLSFEDALEAETERLEAEALVAAPGHERNGEAFRRHSYFARGLYAEQLEGWMRLFPRERFLVVRSEDFFADARSTLERVVEFLGLARFAFRPIGKANARPYPPMDRGARKVLAGRFAEPNRRLAELLGTEVWWTT